MDTENRWNEELSAEFIDYGKYFVPERERQIKIIVDLLPEFGANDPALELCRGKGLLAGGNK